MAIINVNANNVENVKFLRNGNLYASANAAKDALLGFDYSLEQDGTAILARYSGETDQQVAYYRTMVGFVFVSGATKSVTILDVEGAQADVDALREEMRAKFGNGVTENNSVTSQLQVLSGGTFTPGTSSSADTSVEGAKAYAYDLIGTLEYTDTAETGSYVSKVDQVDGIISTTKVALPSVTGTSESKKVVIAVSEDKGTVSDTKGTISSSAGTIVLNDNTDGGIDFDVNIDGQSIVKDANGVLSVASTALTQYTGDTITINVSAADANNNKTISSLLTINKVTTGLDADVREEYHLVGSDNAQIGQAIKIYKDSSLLSVALLHADTTSNPQVLPTYDKATDAWTDIDATAQTQANQALCFAYENVSGNTVIAAVPVGSFINEQEFASGITWDSAESKVRGVVDSNSEKDSNGDSFLTVGADGFKIDGIKDEIAAQLDTIVEGLDATVSNSGTSGHVGVEVVEEDGKLVSVTVSEDDIASETDLNALSAKTVTEIGSSNASIDVSTATTTADDGTVKYDVITDASKIKMSGFTTDNTKSLSAITTSSSVTEAFEEVQDVIDGVNGRIDDLENDFVSGVTVNGTSVVTDHVGVISISGGTSAATSSNAVVVETDNSTGAITISLGTIDCGTY